MIAGVDEAGRGALAGPVVAAAAILPPGLDTSLLKDSKLLTSKIREQLYYWLLSEAEVGIGIVNHRGVDRVNVLQATMIAMAKAVSRLKTTPTLIIIDGNRKPKILHIPLIAKPKADQTEPAVSAASIVAKVVRDHLMTRHALRHPQFSFHIHKGYPTPKHKKELLTFGPSPIHRRTFAPVRAFLEAGIEPLGLFE